jgi:hypothetical protein
VSSSARTRRRRRSPRSIRRLRAAEAGTGWDDVGHIPPARFLDAAARIVPTVDASDPTWLDLTGCGQILELSLGHEDPVESVMFHVRGGEGGIPSCSNSHAPSGSNCWTARPPSSSPTTPATPPSISGGNGVAVTFDTAEADPPQRRFAADLSAPSVADALICPHGWIGDLFSRDLIEPAVVSAEHRDAFPGWALSALTVGDRLHGLPTTTDTAALIRNTRLVASAPTTLDEMAATGRVLREAGRVTEIFTVRVGERGDPFQIWPLFNSAGGWLFGRTPDGGWRMADGIRRVSAWPPLNPSQRSSACGRSARRAPDCSVAL